MVKSGEKKNKGGRPTKYNAEIIPKLEAFTLECLDAGIIPTVERFAFKMGVNRDTLQEWQKKHKKFSVTMGKMMDIQSDMIQTFGLSGKYNSTMSVFLLKNNHGFKDKSEVDNNLTGNLIIERVNYGEPDKS